MPKINYHQSEASLYRFLGFWLVASMIASIYLGWAAIFAWLLSAVALMAMFSALAGGNE